MTLRICVYVISYFLELLLFLFTYNLCYVFTLFLFTFLICLRWVVISLIVYAWMTFMIESSCLKNVHLLLFVFFCCLRTHYFMSLLTRIDKIWDRFAELPYVGLVCLLCVCFIIYSNKYPLTTIGIVPLST